MPTTQKPTTEMPTTQRPSTQKPTTQMPTTKKLTKQIQTTQKPTTQKPTTQMPTTLKPTTQMPNTQKPTTHMSTTQKPMTQMPTTQKPTTEKPTTQMPTTQKPTTQRQSTRMPTTQMPTTRMPTTRLPTTSTTTTRSTTITTIAFVPTTAYYHTSNMTNNILQYVGVSYNLTNGNPVLETDPGLLLHNQVFTLNEYQNGTSREVEITNLTRACYTQYALIHNGKSYQEELLTFVKLTGDHPTQLLDSAFIFNKEYNEVRSYTENPRDTNIYEDAVSVCSEQKLRLKDELADTEPLSISRDFAKDACDLPENYDVNEYVDFLDKWGTSIVTEVMLGTIQLKRYQTTGPDVFNLVSDKNPGLLHHSNSYMGYTSSLTLSRKDFVTNVARTSDLGSIATTYTSGGSLVPVSVKLEPITFAFDWRFWKDIIEKFQATGVCRDDVTMTTIQHMAENINQMLPKYFDIKNKMSGLNLNPLVDNNLQIPVTWPKGTYGLMKPTTGCPAGHVTWHEGWRVQDSRNLGVHNRYSPGIANTLQGYFESRKVLTRFCMKTDSTSSPYDRDWPKGNYCLLKKNNCPSGFSAGSIYWDDRDVINKNKHGGTLPDGTYDRNTKIYYCCRNDGSVSNPITLPVDRAFVLIRYKGVCQKVYNMAVREVFIQVDTADVNNKNNDRGAHPLDDGGKEHKLHYCYYYFNTGGVIVG